MATSPPFCPNGWTPPPESGLAPRPPPDGPGVACHGVSPCSFPNSTLILGGTLLFDIEADPLEEHDVATANPAVVQQLLARLQEFNASNIPQDNSAMDPASSPRRFHNVWTPWRGNPDPRACDWPPLPPPPPMSNVDGIVLTPPSCQVQGWCSGPEYSGPPLMVQIVVDKQVVNTTKASQHRAIAGNHGFVIVFDCSLVRTGSHEIVVEAMYKNVWQPLQKGNFCTMNGHQVQCA